jgi:hypothetical protein
MYSYYLCIECIKYNIILYAPQTHSCLRSEYIYVSKQISRDELYFPNLFFNFPLPRVHIMIVIIASDICIIQFHNPSLCSRGLISYEVIYDCYPPPPPPDPPYNTRANPTGFIWHRTFTIFPLQCRANTKWVLRVVTNPVFFCLGEPHLLIKTLQPWPKKLWSIYLYNFFFIFSTCPFKILKYATSVPVSESKLCFNIFFKSVHCTWSEEDFQYPAFYT